MSDGKKYYCFCSSNCKYETMTKEQILAAIAQAVQTGSVGDVDTGFVTTIKEKNGGKAVTFWVGTQAQYNAIENKDTNCMYIITDDTAGEDIKRTVEQMAQECESSAVAAAKAAKAAQAMEAFDITDEIALEVDRMMSDVSGLTDVEISDKEYTYVPSLNMVFFRVQVYYKGTLAKGAKLRIAHNATATAAGNYAPKTEGTPLVYPMTARNGKFTGEYWGDCMWIYAEEAISTVSGVGSSVDFSGWYYCDGISAAGSMGKMASYVEEKYVQDDGTIFIRKYSDGIAEGFALFIISGVPITTQMGGLYAMTGGAKRFSLANWFDINSTPICCTLNLDGILNADGTKGPEGFIMCSGEATATDSQYMLIVANESIEAATVRLTARVTWKWK